MVCEVKQNESRSVVSSFLQPHRLYSPWNPPGQNTGEWVAFPFSRGSSQTGDWTQVSHIAGGSWRAEPQEKLKNTVLASLPLLQQIFPTQKSNWGLLHCRWILYQLSHKGSPRILEWVAYPFSSRSSQPRNQPGEFCFTGCSLPTELWGKTVEPESPALEGGF